MVFSEVTRFFEACEKIGVMRLGSAADAADQFLSMFLGLEHIKAMLGLGKPSQKQDEALIQRNIRTIMCAFFPNHSDA